MSSNTHYTVFFSFKGGVGRTSALMNVALYLARRKKRVLIIDLDLHAPGVDIFDVTDPALAFRIPSYHPTKCYLGRRWLREQYANARVTTDEKETSADVSAKRFSEMDRYLRGLDLSGETDEVPRGAPKGFLELAQQWAETNRIAEMKYPPINDGSNGDWGTERFVYRLPNRELGEADILVMRAAQHDNPRFRDALKDFSDKFTKIDPVENGNISSPPPFVRELKLRIEEDLRPHYVLIDARPGFDPISVFAMKWLAQSIVFASNLNPWNLNGVFEAYDMVMKETMHRANPNLLLLLSPIPSFARTSKLYADQFETIAQRMEFVRNSGRGADGPPVEIPFSEILSLRDVLLTDIQQSDPSVGRYEQLGQLIISGNPGDIENAIRAAREAGDTGRTQQAFLRLFREYSQDESLPFEYGQFLLSINQIEEARRQFEKAERLVKYWTQSGENDARRSPYRLEIAFYLAKARTAEIRYQIYRHMDRRIFDAAALSQWIIQLDEAAEALKIAISESRDGLQMSHFEMYSLLGEVYELRSDCHEFMLTRDNGPSGRDASDCRNKQVDDLTAAIQQYEVAKTMAPRIAQNRHRLALAQIKYASTRSFGIGDLKSAAVLIKAAEADLSEELKIRFDSADGYLQLARVLLMQSFRIHDAADGKETGFFPLPERVAPYFRCPRSCSDGTATLTMLDSIDGVEAGGFLARCESSLSSCIKFRRQESFAYFHRGLVRSIRGSRAAADSKQRCFQDAIVDYNTTALYEPRYSPAYFYCGMVQFLSAISDDPTHPLTKIRFRQAFYRLEHFIDLELGAFRLTESRGSYKPFYFDPDQIELISEAPLRFLKTLELRLGWPPVLELLVGAQVPGDARFLDGIRRHLDRES
jgi:hypothetical protein